MLLRRLAGPALVCACVSAAPVLAQDAALPATTDPALARPARLSDTAELERRTLHRYAANLGANMVGVLSPRNGAPLLVGGLLAAGSSRFDGGTMSYFDRHAYVSSSFARTGETLGRAPVVAGLTVGLFGASYLTHDTRFKAATYDLSQAIFVNTVYTFALKNAVHRTRPDGSNRLSFPSGHTSSAFAAASVLESHYGPRVGVPAYTLASLIGASRLASRAHHVSDVVAGAALGFVVGRTVVRHDGGPVGEWRFVLAPTTSPSGDGAGLSLNFSF